MEEMFPVSVEHAQVGSYFLGPHGENSSILSKLVHIVLSKHLDARKAMDSEFRFITAETTEDPQFKRNIVNLEKNVVRMADELAAGSMPFWSPRYNAHMNTDTSLPGMVGYIAAMLYNQNNAAPEGGPVTTLWEQEVGEQLCKMLGYESQGKVEPWGHITCGGSIANLEAIWATRNMKFYPLSLRLAMKEDGALHFLSYAKPSFTLPVSQLGSDGEVVRKCFTELSTWELVNLAPEVVLDIPNRLNEEYAIDLSFLDKALEPHLVQTVGKDYLEHKFGLKPGKFFISTTKHYSWPKGGAITGIGSINFINIKVDESARMDMCDLEQHLENCLREKIPVYGGVTIMGSTEHGSCDPLADVIALRKKFQKRGLSFAVHADAAWGGYFATMLWSARNGRSKASECCLSPYTRSQLEHLCFADSITIDPHKSGYINYPAGGLCYRDKRMRNLITWTSPYIFRDGDAGKSMGVYGIEGSKPGASAAAVLLTHNTIGLHNEGYGSLLGGAFFNCTKLYCYWATLEEGNLMITPLIKLPVVPEIGDDEAVKTFIRQRIITKTDKELHADKEALSLMKRLGGDLMINAFACNFKIDGKVNTDVTEANYLNQRLYEWFSITKPEHVANKPPLILTSSIFRESAYGDCLESYKNRIGLVHGGKPARGDLSFLLNVTMSPWPVGPAFLDPMMASFKDIANEEIQNCMMRNKARPEKHMFLLQGLDTIYLVHLPKFHLEDHRRQVILSAKFGKGKSQYRRLKAENPAATYAVVTKTRVLFEDVVKPGSRIEWTLVQLQDSKMEDLKAFEFKIRLSKLGIIHEKSLRFNDLENVYPEKMPFLLYGNKSEVHLNHILQKSPNAALSAELVGLELKSPLKKKEKLAKGVIAVFERVFEAANQPYISESGTKIPWFLPRTTHPISVYDSLEDYRLRQKPISVGSITLGAAVFVEREGLNADPCAR